VSTVPSDEIHEKYLQKAISEINELGDEIVRAAGGAAVPVLGSGHPLADVFLLKHRPQSSEAQEGVAFYGRAGQAVLKVAAAVAGRPDGRLRDELRQVRRGCRRRRGSRLADPGAAHRPAKAPRGDGRGRARVPQRSRLPARPTGRAQARRAPALHPTVEALVVPDIDTSLDEQPAKTAFWNAFKVVGSWWAELPPY